MIEAKRRGACPSFEKPMETGDGLLVRISPQIGSLTFAELEVIARGAQEFGNAVLEVSTRGNLQIRGVSRASHGELMRSVQAAGIRVAKGMPILFFSLFGPGDKGVPEPSHLAKRIAELLEGAVFTSDLAPKTSVIIDAGGLIDVSGLIADVRARYRRNGRSGMWEIHVGGTQNNSRLAGIVESDKEAAQCIVKALELIASGGNCARGRDLTDADLAQIVGEGLAAITGEISTIEAIGEVVDIGRNSLREMIGIHPQRDKNFMLAFALSFGVADAEQIIELAKFASSLGAKKIISVPGKSFVIPDIDRQTAGRLRTKAGELGFVCDADDGRLRIVTCAGAPACYCSFFDTHRVAKDLVETCPDQLLGAAMVHISGCAKRCAQHGSVDLELIGNSEGIGIARIASQDNQSFVTDQTVNGIKERLQRLQSVGN